MNMGVSKMAKPRSSKHIISNHRNVPTIHHHNHSSRHRRRSHSTRLCSHSSHHSWKLPALQHSPLPPQPHRPRPLQQHQQQVPSFYPSAAEHSSSAAAATHSPSAAAPLVADTLLEDTAANSVAQTSFAVFEQHPSYPRHVRAGPRDRLDGNCVGDVCMHQLNRSAQDCHITTAMTR